MRGKVLLLTFQPIVCRITPAYAGKSLACVIYSTALTDHPRLCGEKSQIPLKNSPIPGSPPPMRGKGMQQQRRIRG